MEQLSRCPFAKHNNDLPFEGTFLVCLIPWSFQYCSTSPWKGAEKGGLKKVAPLKVKMDFVSNNNKCGWKTINGILSKHAKQCMLCSEVHTFKDKKKDKYIPRDISGAHSFSFPWHLTQKFIWPIPVNMILWFLLQPMNQLSVIPKHVTRCFTSSLLWYIPPGMG